MTIDDAIELQPFVRVGEPPVPTDHAPLTVVTMMHHRIEFGFFEEWIDYHHRIGVDSIRLYIDISEVVNDRCRPKPASAAPSVWGDKPDYDYHLEMSHEEIVAGWERRLKAVQSGHVEA